MKNKKPNKNFFEQVIEVAMLIPFGKVTTYGAIAKYLGTPGSARMVGWALNSSKTGRYVPAHRVVNRNGLLTGKRHFGGTETMKELLENEGVLIIDNQVQNFHQIYWDPLIELT